MRKRTIGAAAGIGLAGAAGIAFYGGQVPTANRSKEPASNIAP